MLFKKNKRRERSFAFQYDGSRYTVTSKESIKINWIFFKQDPKAREDVNVVKVIASMSRHLRQWSRRHLTLLGKILILKTYAISQVVFLMQSLTLSDKSLKLINNLVYKYLWNKNFNLSKAPDRIKRSLVESPVACGGFGMININDLNKSLDLRSYGRLLVSEHPMLKQISQIVRSKGWLNIEIKQLSVDEKLKKFD